MGLWRKGSSSGWRVAAPSRAVDGVRCGVLRTVDGAALSAGRKKSVMLRFLLEGMFAVNGGAYKDNSGRYIGLAGIRSVDVRLVRRGTKDAGLMRFRENTCDSLAIRASIRRGAGLLLALRPGHTNEV